MKEFAELTKDALLEAAEHMQNCFTLVDMQTPDQELIYVNQAFCVTTGYQGPAIIGRNPRFLQGSLSSPESVRAIRISIQKREAIYQDLINYKSDGTPFWNRMILLPVYLKQAGLHFVGLQNDVTQRKQAMGFTFSNARRDIIGDLELKDRVFNPLTSLLFCKTLLKETPRDDQTMHAALVLRMRSVIARLVSAITELDSLP